MPAWTPAITVTVNGSNYSGFVDWSMSINCAQNEPWDTPLPSTANLSLYFIDTANINPFNIGDKIQLQVNYSTGSAAFYTGKVLDKTYRYLEYGQDGYVFAVNIQLVGALQPLAVMTGVVPNYAPGTGKKTQDMLLALINDMSTTRWNEIDPALTWNDLQTSWTWDTFDTETGQLYNGYTLTMTTNPDIFDAGSASEVISTWGTFAQYLIQSSGIIYEDATGKVIINVGASKPASTSIDSANIDPYSLEGHSGYVDIRNKVHLVAQGAAGEFYYSDQASITSYGAQLTELTGLTLEQPADYNALGNRIVDGLAFPKQSATRIGFELLNPNLTNANRDALLATRLWSGYTLTGLDPIWGYTQNITVQGYTWNISKNSFYLELQAIPTESFFGGNTWAQISPAYTWTSYATAFPTQKWSDL